MAALLGKKQEPLKQRNSFVYFVFSITTNVDTGARSERKIIGIFDNQKDAEALEENFNAQDQEAEGIVTKGFSSRYALPYMAPMAKGLMEGEEKDR